MDEKRELLRHTLATLAYRAARALEGAPDSFAGFNGAGRRPEQILAHMGDLFDWATSMASGSPTWHNSEPLAWEEEKQRFFNSLRDFDGYLASDEPLHAPVDQLFQGPIADALTHVGQLAMMRRLASCPITGENYYVAEVVVGRICAEQAVPVKPFK
jgi:hypothetical protein